MKPLPTHRLLLTWAAILPFALPTGAQRSPYTPKEIPPPATKAARVQITQSPEIESFRNNEAIIRWTSSNPGGTDEHFGVVKYGTDPDHLNQTAKGHIRLNRAHDYTVFRVRVEGLKPGTTYYYTVTSMNADGTEDAVKSGIYHFTAPDGT
jgi:phosphodiesterase/alkaline phosphatase D-like protein